MFLSCILMLEINVLSPRKGSNPGGSCSFKSGNRLVSGYFKYCHTSRARKSSLKVEHQPIYEQVTLQLARSIGLKTIDSYVLSNLDRNVKFKGWKGKDTDPNNRDFYFLSVYIPKSVVIAEKEYRKAGETTVILDSKDDITKIARVFGREKAYLETILVEDVINKRQNYVFHPHRGPDGEIIYLDLGCSFVRAIGGAISVPRGLKRVGSREIRRMKKKLRGTYLISARDDNFVDLGNLAEQIPNLKISMLNPRKNVPLKDLLTGSEMEEVEGYVLQGMVENLPELKKRDLICS